MSGVLRRVSTWGMPEMIPDGRNGATWCWAPRELADLQRRLEAVRARAVEDRRQREEAQDHLNDVMSENV